jgi:hypothetical protein
VRPKYVRYIKNNPDEFFLLAWFRMLLFELGCKKDLGLRLGSFQMRMSTKYSNAATPDAAEAGNKELPVNQDSSG